MADLRQCPECGKQYPGNVRFCRQDGALLSPTSEPTMGAKVVVQPLPPLRPPVRRKPPPVDARQDQLVGRVIAGRFELDKLLGQGASGVVYRAVHKLLKKPLAVKLLKRELVWDERSLQRFLREARTCSVMDHPNIVYLYDFGRDEEGIPYLVMEYVAGETLHSAIHNSSTRTLPIDRVVPILLQVARALDHAHGRGVIHRDIKPENIVLTLSENRPDFVKVLDFGVARIVGQAPVTGHGQVTGTAEFIAPETLVGDGVVAPSGDIYAVGILFHDALVGRPPFTGRLDVVLQQHLNSTAPLISERSGDPTIPEELDLLVRRLLEKDPAKRPTAAQLVSQLEEIVRAVCSPVEIPPPKPLDLHEQATQRIGLHQRPTAVVTSADRKTTVIDRHGKPTRIIERSAWPTQALLGPGSEDAAAGPPDESWLAQGEERSGALHQAAFALALRLWPSGTFPQALQNLRLHIEGCEQRERSILAEVTAIERHQRERELAERRHAELRQLILNLSGQLQSAQSLNGDERQSLLGQMEELERAFFASEEARAEEGPADLGEPMQRLLSVRADRSGARALFARLLLAMPCPSAATEERDRLGQILSADDISRISRPPGTPRPVGISRPPGGQKA